MTWLEFIFPNKDAQVKCTCYHNMYRCIYISDLISNNSWRSIFPIMGKGQTCVKNPTNDVVDKNQNHLRYVPWHTLSSTWNRNSTGYGRWSSALGRKTIPKFSCFPHLSTSFHISPHLPHLSTSFHIFPHLSTSFHSVTRNLDHFHDLSMSFGSRPQWAFLATRWRLLDIAPAGGRGSRGAARGSRCAAWPQSRDSGGWSFGTWNGYTNGLMMVNVNGLMFMVNG